MINQTWTVVELLWTAGHLIGFLANLRLLKMALRKRGSAQRRCPSANRSAHLLAADRYIRNDACRLLFFTMGTAIGIWALLVLEPDDLFRWISQITLVAMGLLLLLASLWDLADEPTMVRLLEADDQERKAQEEQDGIAFSNPTRLLRELQERRRGIAPTPQRDPSS